jgi:hypothetical protein
MLRGAGHRAPVHSVILLVMPLHAWRPGAHSATLRNMRPPEEDPIPWEKEIKEAPSPAPKPRPRPRPKHALEVTDVTSSGGGW